MQADAHNIDARKRLRANTHGRQSRLHLYRQLAYVNLLSATETRRQLDRTQELLSASIA
jgi:hypothetical protein